MSLSEDQDSGESPSLPREKVQVPIRKENTSRGLQGQKRLRLCAKHWVLKAKV